MTLEEKFGEVAIVFEGQEGSLKYDEMYQSATDCAKIAEDFAISFAEFIEGRDLYLEKKTILEAFAEFKESLK